jgi:hypothetical protein
MEEAMNIERTIDNFFLGASEEVVEMSDWEDIDLIRLALEDNHEAQLELDRRINALSKTAEPDLVKVARNAIDDALAALDALPDAGEGTVEIPWKIQSRPKVDTSKWADAELRSFAIEELCATQTILKRDNVRWHLEHLNEMEHDNKAMPNILTTEKGNLIYDGHHRLAALWLLGADVANCWKVDY